LLLDLAAAVLVFLPADPVGLVVKLDLRDMLLHGLFQRAASGRNENRSPHPSRRREGCGNKEKSS
jgi:hypothetical protein